MRIISWNIRAGGGKRISGIKAQLDRWQADVVALSEFRGTPASQKLAGWLHDAGLSHQLSTIDRQTLAKNALLLASRFPLTPIMQTGIAGAPTRWLMATIASPIPLTMGVMHIPNRVSGYKYLFFEHVLSIVRQWTYGHGLLIGDTNSGLPQIDEETRVFNQKEAGWINALDAAGWADSYRQLHGNKRVFTWYSPNGNNGFRLDQAFANPQLQPHIHNVRYEWGQASQQTERRDALSDHAAIIIDL